MADSDIKIVAISVLIAVTYGTFLFLNSSAGSDTFNPGGKLNSSAYNTPDSKDFVEQVETLKKTNVDIPEIFFINTILFGTIAFLLVFVGLRFLRGSG